MRNIKIALGAGTIAILGGVLFFRTPSPVSAPRNPQSDQHPQHSGSPAQKAAPVPVAAAPLVAPSSSRPAPPPTESAATEIKVFEHQRELDEYHLLSQKVFLTDQERRQKQGLLQNAQFIESLKSLFKSQKPTEELEDQQNTAVDFLMEALNGPAKEAAAGVLKSVIQNPDTENAKLDMATRENLAGAKAEVLYKWSAQDPSRNNEIRQWLPGAVSQRIWANVLYQQEMNRLESALTK